MFTSVGFLEIAVIGCIALMVLGPEKFPGFAKLSIRTFRDIKKYLSEAQRDIANELNPMKDELNKLKKVDVEGYVEKLIGEDEDTSKDSSEEDDDDDGELNVEPHPSTMDDWHPEDQNEIMPGGDETAEMGEDSAQEFAGESVPYEDPSASTNGSQPEIIEPEQVEDVKISDDSAPKVKKEDADYTDPWVED